MKEFTKLTPNDDANQTTRTRHFILVLIVFLIFLSSITLAFVKSYKSIYGEIDQARIIELSQLNVDAFGHFVVMASLLILFHFQNKEQNREENGDRERALSSAMIRTPSVN